MSGSEIVYEETSAGRFEKALTPRQKRLLKERQEKREQLFSAIIGTALVVGLIAADVALFSWAISK